MSLSSRFAAPVAFVLFAGSALLCTMARYDWNFTSLIRFGHRYIEQNQHLTPPGAVRFLGNEANGGNGYDGQIFYFYAKTLWTRGEWPTGFSNAYRAPRVGYPLLASLFSWMGQNGTALGMILSQIILILAGTMCMREMMPDQAKARTIFFALSPFLLQSFAFLVSDGVMISLAVIGIFFSRRSGIAASIGAWFFFSLAVLTKESSLFLLFPYGLWALYRRDLRLASLLLGSIAPMIAWQVYLRSAHGMVPASILSTFLSPLDGIRGVFSQAWLLLQTRPLPLVDLFKLSAKLLLIAVIPAGAWAALAGFRKTELNEFAAPFRLSALLVLLSICIADYQYFWGIFENVGRMFTALVPAVLLARSRSGNDRSQQIFAVLLLLTAALVWARICFLAPAFPFDHYYPYSGPRYPLPPVP